MTNELKPCPYRVHGERTMSLTVAGEYYYNEYFMPCMGSNCPCFHRDGDDAYCDRNGTYMMIQCEKHITKSQYRRIKIQQESEDTGGD